MKKIWTSLILFMLIVGVIAGVSKKVFASDSMFESDNTVVVSENKDSALFVSGETIIIEGDVNGPLFAAGQSITIEGDVNGSVFAAGNTITIEGNVQGEVFLAGNSIRATEEAELSRDVFVAGNQIIIDSIVGRDFFVGSNSTRIQSEIGRNGYISTNTLTFDENGQINGDLTYQSQQEIGNIEEFVQGEVNYHETPQRNEQMMPRRSILSIVLRIAGAVISAVLIWAFLYRVTQKRWITLSPQAINRPILLILIGLGISLLIPITVFLLLLSNIFINIGVLLLILFGLLLFFGKIVTASAISKYMFKKYIPENSYREVIRFIVAYTLLLLTSYLPYVGWIISLFCIFYTVGLAFREILIRFQTRPV